MKYGFSMIIKANFFPWISQSVRVLIRHIYDMNGVTKFDVFCGTNYYFQGLAHSMYVQRFLAEH